MMCLYKCKTTRGWVGAHMCACFVLFFVHLLYCDKSDIKNCVVERQAFKTRASESIWAIQ